MTAENRSNTQIVREALSRMPRRDIPKTTGLTRVQVSTAVSYLRRLGELPHPSPEESRRTMSESVSDARGGLLLVVEPFLRRRLKPAEVTKKLQRKGLEVDRDQVARALNKARMKSRRARGKRKTTPEKAPMNRAPVQAIEARDKTKEARESLHARGASSEEVSYLLSLGSARQEQDKVEKKSLVEIKDLAMARRLLKSNFYTEDLTDWDMVQDLFDQNNAEIRSFEHHLVLEALFKIRRYMVEKNSEMLGLYGRVEECSSPSWKKMKETHRDKIVIMRYGTK